MRAHSSLKLVLVTFGFTAAAQPSTVATTEPVRLQVTWASPLPVPEGATIKLEVTGEAISVTTVTNLWHALGPTERSVDIPMPERAVFDSTLRRAGGCQRVAPTQARLGWLSLGVWVGGARLGQLELFEGNTPVLVGYADVDSQQPDSPPCKALYAPVLAAGWNVLRIPEGAKSTARPLRGPLTARYVSAMPAATKSGPRLP